MRLRYTYVTLLGLEACAACGEGTKNIQDPDKVSWHTWHGQKWEQSNEIRNQQPWKEESERFLRCSVQTQVRHPALHTRPASCAKLFFFWGFSKATNSRDSGVFSTITRIQRNKRPQEDYREEHPQFWASLRAHGTGILCLDWVFVLGSTLLSFSCSQRGQPISVLAAPRVPSPV